MAAVGHTINTELWGNTGIFVDGISIPDAARFQQREIEKAGPGKRLPIGMNPLIVLRDGKPVLGGSAVGGGLHYKTVQVLANILDFGMDPRTAIDTPYFLPDGVEEGTFAPDLIENVEALGMKVRILPSEKVMRGYWVESKSILLKRAHSREASHEVWPVEWLDIKAFAVQPLSVPPGSTPHHKHAAACVCCTHEREFARSWFSRRRRRDRLHPPLRLRPGTRQRQPRPGREFWEQRGDGYRDH